LKIYKNKFSKDLNNTSILNFIRGGIMSWIWWVIIIILIIIILWWAAKKGKKKKAPAPAEKK